MDDEATHAAADPAASAPAQSDTPSSPSPTPSTPSTETSTDARQSKESLLDAVLKVVPATTERDVLTDKPMDTAADPEAATKDQPDSEDQAETDDGADDEEPPAEAAPAVRKKINKLLKQRRELRAELSQLQGPAQIGSELDTYAKKNDLSGEDIANTLQMAAMLRAGDYKAFYQAVAPFVRTAQEYLGIVLPKDLGERVKA